jgi:uncharacterized protein YndB with AHSA1/START domain
MTQSTRQTQIEVDDKVPMVRLIREFDAPPEKVFRAHVDPELVSQWLGPRSLTMQIDHYDCRTGGAYRYLHRRGDEEYGFYGSFHEVRPSERIVQTFSFDGAPDGVSLETMTLEALDGGRCRIVGVSVVESLETRDQILSSGMDVGVNEGYEKLDELLASAD